MSFNLIQSTENPNHNRTNFIFNCFVDLELEAALYSKLYKLVNDAVLVAYIFQSDGL